MDYNALGTRIRQERIKQNLTQEKLAELCGLSDSYIGIVERAEKHITVDTLVKIATALGVGADYLLCDSMKNLHNSKLDSLIRGLSPDEENMVLDILNVVLTHSRKK